MARRTIEEAEETRRRILTEAIRRFSDSGYADLSLEELAQTLHVTRGAVYHHFQNKRGLFIAALENLLDQSAQTVLHAAASGPSKGEDPLEALLQGCDGFLRCCRRPEYRRIVLIDAPAVLGVERWQELDERSTTTPLAEVLNELISARMLKVDDVEATTQALSGAMNQLGLRIRDDESLKTAQTAIREIIGGLLGPPWHTEPLKSTNAFREIRRGDKAPDYSRENR